MHQLMGAGALGFGLLVAAKGVRVGAGWFAVLSQMAWLKLSRFPTALAARCDLVFGPLTYQVTFRHGRHHSKARSGR